MAKTSPPGIKILEQFAVVFGRQGRGRFVRVADSGDGETCPYGAGRSPDKSLRKML